MGLQQTSSSSGLRIVYPVQHYLSLAVIFSIISYFRPAQVGSVDDPGIVGFAADPVVHREARVAPVEHAVSESGIQHTFGTQEMQYLVTQRIAKRRLRQRRQHPEGTGGQEHAVGDQGVNDSIQIWAIEIPAVTSISDSELFAQFVVTHHATRKVY